MKHKASKDFLSAERLRFFYADHIQLPNFAKHIGTSVTVSIIISVLLLIFVPWIQTSSGAGYITTLNPHDRQQNITALVPGRIKKWYVHEGDIVKKGDPLLEIVDNDPRLVERLTSQKDALEFKYKAAQIATDTAKLNYDRQKILFRKTLSSKLDVEKAKINYKNYISQREQAEAQLRDAESKLSRQETQKIVAPIGGAITQITAGNLATSVKKGEVVATLIPLHVPLAVELYISGLDISLMEKNQKVRLQFEGWPSIQFSGWPHHAIGTFGGIIHAIDPAASINGKFRILIIPDPKEQGSLVTSWPDHKYLRYGAKVQGWVLLNKVPLGYELWRQLNAFPPEYTKPEDKYKDENMRFNKV